MVLKSSSLHIMAVAAAAMVISLGSTPCSGVPVNINSTAAHQTAKSDVTLTPARNLTFSEWAKLHKAPPGFMGVHQRVRPPPITKREFNEFIKRQTGVAAAVSAEITADDDDTYEVVPEVDDPSADTTPVDGDFNEDDDLNLDAPVDIDTSVDVNSLAGDDDGESDTTADDPPDVPDDLPADSGPEIEEVYDGPVAAGSLDPRVLKKGKSYVWTMPNFNTKSIKPLGPKRDTWGGRKPNINRSFVKNPTNSKETVLRVNFPKGTSTPTSKFNPKGKKGGTGLYLEPIPKSIVAKAKYVTFEYDVYFPKGFDFNRGGKLPGLFGGNGNSYGCSGGSPAAKCFSARYMWRVAGAGELYLYSPKSAKQNPSLCHQKVYSHCDATYGSSIGRGSFRFKTGAWTHVKQLIKVNDIGKQNGIIKIWANGKLAINFSKLVWRTVGNVQVQGIAFETFFGGSTKEHACKKNEFNMFKNFQMVAAY